MSAQALEVLLTDNLRARDLTKVPGRLAFMHKGQAVDIEIDEHIYRGYSISVYDGSPNASEFRPEFDAFNWDAIASAVTRSAERRLAASRGTPRSPVYPQHQYHYAMA